MKKIISIILAVMMSVACLTANAVPSFAAWFSSIESADKDIIIKVTIDGEDSVHGEYTHTTKEETGKHPVIDFVYTGKKDVLYWDITDHDGNHLEEGKDFEYVKKEETKIVIEIINPAVTEIWANAVTDNNTTSQGDKEDQGGTNTESTTKTKVKHPDKSITSPNTGAGVLGASVVATGAGVALLGAVRKRK